MLTHAGIREMEQALSNPDRPTDHFAAINILNIGTMSGGQVMQGSSNGTQNLAQSGKEGQEAAEFVAAVRNALANAELDAARRIQAENGIAIIEAEVAKPEPDWKMARAIGSSIKTTIESGLGGALAAGILALPWPHS